MKLVTASCLLYAFLLTACSSKQTPTIAMETQPVATIDVVPSKTLPDATQAKVIETVTPVPKTEAVQGVKTETPYPGPYPQAVQGSGGNTAYPGPSPYPAPGQVNTLQSSSNQNAYPAPTIVEPGQQTADSSAYPAPGTAVQQPSTPMDNPYPSPQTNTPPPSQPTATFPNRVSQTPTPSLTLTATPAGTSIPSPTPTQMPTPTEIEVDPNFHPTDPSTVLLASGKAQLVEFFAYWCGECRAMAPLVHSLEAQYQDRMNFIYLDTDNPATRELKQALGYRDQPDNPQFFLLDKSGKILEKWVGAVSADQFENSINAALMK